MRLGIWLGLSRTKIGMISLLPFLIRCHAECLLNSAIAMASCNTNPANHDMNRAQIRNAYFQGIHAIVSVHLFIQVVCAVAHTAGRLLRRRDSAQIWFGIFCSGCFAGITVQSLNKKGDHSAAFLFSSSELLAHPLPCILEHLQPCAVLLPAVGMPGILHGAEHPLGMRHHDGEAPVACRQPGDALR
jgi:hypothetical protein